jgi:2-dehydro-3-deoxygluconokinase
MNKVLCFGELLLRMSPALQGKWLQNALMPVYTGGAELNVAAALAKWEIPVSYFTALPENYLSKEICNDLKQRNIDINNIHFSGNRIGIYFLPQGADLKHAGVIYDRSNSSFAELKPGMIDWENMLKNISWFHFSAISPALNENAALVCREVLEAAKKKNVTISVDLNYRSKLWQYGKKPLEIMPELVQHCDVIMGNIWSANILLGIEVDEDIHGKGKKEHYLEHAKQTAINIQKQFPKCKTVANTFRFDINENGILYYTSLFNNGEQYHSAEFKTDKITDKVGSGDCFMAGLIYGLYNNHAPQQIINFATAAAFGKLHETGDFTSQDIETINKRLMNHG